VTKDPNSTQVSSFITRLADLNGSQWSLVRESYRLAFPNPDARAYYNHHAMVMSAATRALSAFGADVTRNALHCADNVLKVLLAASVARRDQPQEAYSPFEPFIPFESLRVRFDSIEPPTSPGAIVNTCGSACHAAFS